MTKWEDKTQEYEDRFLNKRIEVKSSTIRKYRPAIGKFGLVIRISGSSLGVQIDDMTNKGSAYGVFWFKRNEIKIVENKEKTSVINIDEILLLGMHNVENACTAIAAIKDLVSIESIRKVLTTFKGVEHRNEFVRELNGVKWYNDSIGSSPTRTIAGLASFKEKVILIAGGYDKHLDYTAMGNYILDHVKILILMGQTKEKIKTATLAQLKERGDYIDLPIFECESLEEVINVAYENSVAGDIVFFSPASASFDMFKNFAERGNKFKELVNGLKN